MLVTLFAQHEVGWKKKIRPEGRALLDNRRSQHSRPALTEWASGGLVVMWLY